MVYDGPARLPGGQAGECKSLDPASGLPPGITDPWPARHSLKDCPAGTETSRKIPVVLDERAFGKLTVLRVPLDAVPGVSGLTALVYCPGGYSPGMPVVFVMHGIYRDPWNYLESWVGLAEHHGFVLVVPEFPRSDWPTNRQYNLGNVRAKGGADVSAGAWSFTALDRVFDAVCEHFQLRTRTFSMYGHSAGAQFVHRYVLHTGGARVDRAVSANAGWYMTPDQTVRYPYGIADLPIDWEMLRAAFETRLIVLLGEKDNDPRSRNLRTQRRAMAQGPHRFARGRHFMKSAEAVAAAMGLPLNWRLKTVPEVGHNDRAIAPHGCAALFGTVHHQE